MDWERLEKPEWRGKIISDAQTGTLISSSRAAIRWSSWFSSLYDASPSIILFTSSIFALFASKYYRSLLATLSFMSRCISLSIALHSILVATSATVLLTSAIFALRESAFASSCLLHREWTYRSNSWMASSCLLNTSHIALKDNFTISWILIHSGPPWSSQGLPVISPQEYEAREGCYQCTQILWLDSDGGSFEFKLIIMPGLYLVAAVALLFSASAYNIQTFNYT